MRHIPESDRAAFKQALETELKELETELEAIGRRKPSNPADWEAEAPLEETQPGDYNEQADRIEGYEENTAILKELEIRYNNVKRALEKMEAGTYGICEVSGEEIELERLEANHAARTCVAHKDVELA